jgi:hypothetical protein
METVMENLGHKKTPHCMERGVDKTNFKQTISKMKNSNVPYDTQYCSNEKVEE